MSRFFSHEIISPHFPCSSCSVVLRPAMFNCRILPTFFFRKIGLIFVGSIFWFLLRNLTFPRGFIFLDSITSHFVGIFWACSSHGNQRTWLIHVSPCYSRETQSYTIYFRKFWKFTILYYIFSDKFILVSFIHY